jgi:hypothetical protein
MDRDARALRISGEQELANGVGKRKYETASRAFRLVGRLTTDSDTLHLWLGVGIDRGARKDCRKLWNGFV